MSDINSLFQQIEEILSGVEEHYRTVYQNALGINESDEFQRVSMNAQRCIRQTSDWRSRLSAIADEVNSANIFVETSDAEQISQGNSDDIKEKFMKMCIEMKMTYSYKPVLIKAILQYSDEKGRTKITKIINYFKQYYNWRKTQGLFVEKSGSLFSRDNITDKEVGHLILSNPYKRFEIMQMLEYDRTTGFINVAPAIWGKLSDENKAVIKNVCDQRLKEYFQKITPSTVSVSAVDDEPETKVGMYIRHKMRELSSAGHIFTEDEIEFFKRKPWSNVTFGLDYPFARIYSQQSELSQQIKDDNGYNRYWKEIYNFGNTQLLICSQWFEEDKQRFDKWYQGLLSSSEIIKKEEVVLEAKPQAPPEENKKREPQLIAGTKPKSMTLLGKTYSVSSWNELYVKVCEIMLLREPYIMARFNKDSEFNTGERTNFSYIESEILYNRKRLSNGLWIETNKSADDCYRSSRRILEKCGYKPDLLTIKIRED
jgi:hypothetical protein